MIYLASPYTHKQPEVEQLRYEQVMDITAHLMGLNCPVFSPIVHCHILAKKYKLPTDFSYWQSYSESAIVSCESFMIAAIDGWKDSRGVRTEYKFAVNEDKRISLVEQKNTGYWVMPEAITKNPFN